MKKGICMGAFPKGISLNEVFALAEKYGYDGVELSMAATGELTPDTDCIRLDKIKQSAKEHGLELYSVSSSLCWDYTFTDENEGIRKKAMSLAKSQIDIASYLGCDTVLMLAGVVSAVFVPQLAVVPYDVAYKRAISAVCEIGEYAAEKKVYIGIENVWNNFLLSPLEMRNFIDEVDNEYVGAYFDVGNVVVNGYPEHWIRILGNRIKKVHFKDFKRSVGNINGFCDLLEGDVDYKAVMEALSEIGYNDWVSAEISRYKMCNNVMLRRTKDAMDHIISNKI